MTPFTKVPNGSVLVRKPKGFLEQMDLYKRGENLYIKARNGFLLVIKHGNNYRACHMDYTILELEPGNEFEKHHG